MIRPGEIARLAHRLGLGDKTIEAEVIHVQEKTKKAA